VPARNTGRANPHLAAAGGFSLHAGVAVRAGDRGTLERLCRYITRRTLATGCLALTPGNPRKQGPLFGLYSTVLPNAAPDRGRLECRLGYRQEMCRSLPGNSQENGSSKSGARFPLDFPGT
jgi:hypothetical protein